EAAGSCEYHSTTIEAGTAPAARLAGWLADVSLPLPARFAAIPAPPFWADSGLSRQAKRVILALQKFWPRPTGLDLMRTLLTLTSLLLSTCLLLIGQGMQLTLTPLRASSNGMSDFL